VRAEICNIIAQVFDFANWWKNKKIKGAFQFGDGLTRVAGFGFGRRRFLTAVRRAFGTANGIRRLLFGKPASQVRFATNVKYTRNKKSVRGARSS
jgi:hypothetical protein